MSDAIITILEAKAQKKELEQVILKAISAFEEATGTVVENISMMRVDTFKGAHLMNVNANVSLD